MQTPRLVFEIVVAVPTGVASQHRLKQRASSEDSVSQPLQIRHVCSKASKAVARVKEATKNAPSCNLENPNVDV
jgi:hypothetical protein